jgi:Protein of unknown function (DUF4012)
VLAALILLAALVFSYQAARTVLALRQAKNEAHQLSGEIRRNDLDAVKQTLRTIESRSRTARGHSDNVMWDAAGVLPFLGDDIEAVRVLARVLNDASDGTSEPMVSLLTRLDGDQLRDADGRLDLAAIGDLAPSMQQMSTALRGAADDVDELEPDRLLGPLADVTTTVQDQIHTALATAEGGETVAGLLPAMLGGSGPRSYLLVVQNNAETRSTGGLPGSLSILNARDGQLSLGAQRSVDDFDVLTQPVLELTDEERALYGDNLGENIRDTNLTPDFPRAAELMSALQERTFGAGVDGVISVDPVALASVLKVTGPVTVAKETFTSRNVVRKLLNEVYQRLETREEQDAYFARAARGIFTTLITREVDSLKLVRNLGRAASQRRFLVWSSREEEQRQLAGHSVAGELPRDTGRVPQVGLYLNDATAAKIEYYLDYRANLRSAGCTDDGAQTLQMGMVLTSSAPRRGFELSPYVTGFGRYAGKGTIRLNLRIYAPTGGKLTELTANGEPVRIESSMHHGRQVAIVTMFIRARQEVRLSGVIRTRDGQSGDPELRWTPGVRTRTSGVTAASSC